MDIETIAKFAFSGGIVVFLINGLIKYAGKVKLKMRLTKEIAWEFFINEYCVVLIIKDFQNLQEDPCGYLHRHKFKTQVINSIISSGYYVNLNFGLSQLVLEFDQRFKLIQYGLDKYFSLENEDKIEPINLELLRFGEKNSKILLSDLSKKLEKLKKKYYKEWYEERAKIYDKTYNIKVDSEAIKKALEEIRAEVNK